jgi:DNA-binding PadR family transcriptional regulator
MRRRTSRLEHKENMAHQLLILGLLAEGPKHGYQIKKLMREISGRFTTIDTSSIYYPLTQLEKEGFLEKRVGRS